MSAVGLDSKEIRAQKKKVKTQKIGRGIGIVEVIIAERRMGMGILTTGRRRSRPISYSMVRIYLEFRSCRSQIRSTHKVVTRRTKEE